MDVSSLLRSPVHFGFFDIDASSRFSDILLAQFNSSCELFSYPLRFLTSHFILLYVQHHFHFLHYNDFMSPFEMPDFPHHSFIHSFKTLVAFLCITNIYEDSNILRNESSELSRHGYGP
jgi:hypothetical protein